MKTIVFDNELKHQSVSDLIHQLQQACDQSGIVQCYFSSNGGENPAAMVLMDFLGLHADQIELIGYGFLFSNGFDVLFNYPGRKRVLPQTVGMVHHNWQNFSSVNLLPKPDDKGTLFVAELNQMNQQSLEMYRPFLTKAELKKFKQGYDVYLGYDRMSNLFNTIHAAPPTHSGSVK